MMRHLALLIALSIIFFSSALVADTSVVEKQLFEKLQRIKTLQADFTQESYDAKNVLLQKQNGDFKVKESGVFIWNIAAPYEQKIISDGVSLKIFDPDLEQLIIKPLDKKAQVIPLLLFSGESERLSQHYSVSSVALNVFELKSKNKNSLFDNLQITFVDDKPSLLVITDSLQQKTLVKFTKSSINLPLRPSLFQFEAPSNIDVIDER